jgi:hypothetical protein
MSFHKKVCICCKKAFFPCSQNVKRQNYCSEPECRKASKKSSQKRWLDKNPGHFSGSECVERVRQWRLAHPGYSRRKVSGDTLQDFVPLNPVIKQEVTPHLPLPSPPSTPPLVPLQQALQVFDIMQVPFFVGLLAQISGLTLQEDLGLAARSMQQYGLDVISAKGVQDDQQVANLSRSCPHCSRAVQLGGSPSGS